MKFSMNAKLSVAIIGHFATRGAAQQRVKLTDGTEMPQPVLTTILGDAIHKPIPTNGSGFTVVGTEMCRAITTTTCEWIEVTSTMTSEVMTTPMVTTSEATTSQVQTSVITEETTSVATPTTGSTSGASSSVMTPSVSASGTITPIPSSGADKTGAGLVAGLALLLVI
ncbi:hypothetical protein GCG54_00010551 [Colletotrichum gloeosporioides]|uniref:Uncharacterized protein n=1 Tax=Colletotrichum gloeosporioides TaxID=474922 RepID=A0A8H4C6B9_COLGL|nr:uncharacterized protein GCG54_00010551 [Colletotrichum gloeosporioides]KAF3798204.1 hypothetical protein GCG54_00010551 [Colletotrichum gloeosporioides]